MTGAKKQMTDKTPVSVETMGKDAHAVLPLATDDMQSASQNNALKGVADAAEALLGLTSTSRASTPPHDAPTTPPYDTNPPEPATPPPDVQWHMPSTPSPTEQIDSRWQPYPYAPAAPTEMLPPDVLYQIGAYHARQQQMYAAQQQNLYAPPPQQVTLHQNLYAEQLHHQQLQQQQQQQLLLQQLQQVQQQQQQQQQRQQQQRQQQQQQQFSWNTLPEPRGQGAGAGALGNSDVQPPKGIAKRRSRESQFTWVTLQGPKDGGDADGENLKKVRGKPGFTWKPL
jgi:hypothetical protein